jgi:hypothetical protein
MASRIQFSLWPAAALDVKANLSDMIEAWRALLFVVPVEWYWAQMVLSRFGTQQPIESNKVPIA